MLVRELGQAQRIAPNVYASDALVPTAFAAQLMPNAEPLAGESINAIARGILDKVLALPDAPWRLHVFAAPGVSTRRALLIHEALDELLKKKQRRLLRTRLEPSTRRQGETVVQVLLTALDAAFISISADPRISPFVGGIPTLVEDERPPSRAYLKLLEMEAHLGERIASGETCVDLGGSPGGWTFVALDRGASCVSVDRSPLRDDIMANPAFTFVKGDAFAYMPPAKVDWLLCDVIATPDRSIAMLRTWLEKKLCKRFCVTLKFKGDVDLDAIREARALVQEHASHSGVRRLAVNKNEVSVFGEAR